MASTHRRLAVAASAASLVLLVPLAPAFAGHANTLLEGRLTGRAEVGTSKALAGDPNGRGEVYVYGIDGDPTTLCYVLTVSKIAPAAMVRSSSTSLPLPTATLRTASPRARPARSSATRRWPTSSPTRSSTTSTCTTRSSRAVRSEAS